MNEEYRKIRKIELPKHVADKMNEHGRAMLQVSKVMLQVPNVKQVETADDLLDRYNEVSRLIKTHGMDEHFQNTLNDIVSKLSNLKK